MLNGRFNHDCKLLNDFSDRRHVVVAVQRHTHDSSLFVHNYFSDIAVCSHSPLTAPTVLQSSLKTAPIALHGGLHFMAQGNRLFQLQSQYAAGQSVSKRQYITIDLVSLKLPLGWQFTKFEILHDSV